jgi:hypothetical protein
MGSPSRASRSRSAIANSVPPSVSFSPCTRSAAFRKRGVAGQNNRATADCLVNTEGTAEVHVRHIMNNLGLTSRTQVAVWATRRGLVSVA